MRAILQYLSTTSLHYQFSELPAGLQSSSMPEVSPAFWIRLLYTAFVLAMIPVYWKHRGPANFLWFSDIGLFLSLGAIWLKSSLLSSVLAVGIIIPSLYWTFELIIRLFSGKRLSGLTDYLWNSRYPLFLRLLSLFHVFLPLIFLLLLSRWGYDPRAPYIMTLLGWVILFLCYKLTPPSANINRVFGFGPSPQHKISSRYFVLIIMSLYPILIFFPTHLLLLSFF